MLQPGQFYHIYNHANGHENLFLEERNYHFFLSKIKLYLLPVCNLYAYCLMPNHFHLLVSIKNEGEIVKLLESSETFQKLTSEERFTHIEKKISKSFSNLCSSYTQALNKVYQRRGSLFMPNFKNTLVENELAFCNMVYYIHSNPVHHGFVKNITDWKFSSFNSLISEKLTGLERNYVLDAFGGRVAFDNYHKQSVEIKS